jgi:hypothetical protein
MSVIKCTFFAILGLLLLSSNTICAQEEVSQKNIIVKDLVLNAEKVIFENHQVKIAIRKEELFDTLNGMHHERVTFHYTNKTNTAISLQFNKLNMYEGSSARGEGKVHKIDLPANSNKIYSDIHKSKSYYSFSKDLKGTIRAELMFIVLNNIIIS